MLCNLFLKRALILFWGIWWFIAFLTDVIGGLYHLQIITTSWFPNTNYLFLVESLQKYYAPAWLPAILYAGIILLSGISTALFISAVINFRKPSWLSHASTAFIFSICYWLIFFLADQLLMNFSLEENHMVQGGFELLCYLAICLLPHQSKPAAIVNRP